MMPAVCLRLAMHLPARLWGPCTAAMRRYFFAAKGCEALAVAMETCAKTLDLQRHAIYVLYVLAHADGGEHRVGGVSHGGAPQVVPCMPRCV